MLLAFVMLDFRASKRLTQQKERPYNPVASEIARHPQH
jgi:hypothetical protein